MENHLYLVVTKDERRRVIGHDHEYAAIEAVGGCKFIRIVGEYEDAAWLYEDKDGSPFLIWEV